MNLDQAKALGADVNAGHLDLYDAPATKHLRLADVLASGDVLWTPEGEVWRQRVELGAEVQAEADHVVEPAVEPAVEAAVVEAVEKA